MRRGRLTEGQTALARAFFSETREFFLTGGAVLAGWELCHRPTDDLDLFTTRDDAMATGDAALRRAVDGLAGSVESVSTTPDFRRYVVELGAERVKVDLVRDRVPQVCPKEERDGIIMDSREEIFANKLCTLVERSEIRDLVDLMLLERAGLSAEATLPLAQQKDGGATPATIAWLLSTLHVPDALPAGVPREELLAYARDLEARMLRLAAPE